MITHIENTECEILQEDVLSGMIGEANYQRCSFLDVRDFTTKENQQSFLLIKKHKGNVVEIWRQKYLPKKLYTIRNLAVYKYLELAAVKLVEQTFSRLLNKLISELQINAIEKDDFVSQKIYENILKEINELDIMHVSDGLLDYCKPLVPEDHYKRIQGYTTYFTKRINELKTIYQRTSKV